MEPVSIALALAQFAPGLIRHFAGDKPARVAEAAISIAQELTGASTPEAALQTLRANPELQLEYVRIIEEKDRYFAMLAQQDRASARQRDVELAKAGIKNHRADVLAYGALAMLMGCLATLFTMEVPEGSKDILLMLIGALIVVVKDLYGFEFGSSAGSKNKDIQLNHLGDK